MGSIPLWAAILAAIGTVAIAVLTYLLVRLNQRLANFAGAMESHSELMLRLKFKEENLPVVWWDKTVEPWPDENKRHRNRSELTHVVLGVPERLRWGTAMRRHVGLLVVGLVGAIVTAFWLFGWAPGALQLVAAWMREILFTALVLFGLLFLYALIRCSRKLLELERLRPAVLPEQSSEGR